ncbi:hypothetical protein BC629DRAFT_31379 [Irpex lacteus]|nr:hypothetical protein BC629DRAFT_31379 [Irpex lacteus]
MHHLPAMSSDIAALEHALISNYVTLSAEVLFLFDCAITLSQEVDVIWRRKWNTTTWLYALMRYAIVMDMIALLLPVWNYVFECPNSCEVGNHVDHALRLTQYLCLAWFSALRVYALLDGKYIVTALVLLLNVVPCATNIFNFATSVIIINTEECTFLPGGSNAQALILSFVGYTHLRDHR